MPTSPARRRTLLLGTGVLAAALAFLGPWGASPESGPVAEVEPETARSQDAPLPCTLRAPRARATPLDDLAAPIEEWFVLKGSGKPDLAPVLRPWFVERVAEAAEPAQSSGSVWPEGVQLAVSTPAPILLELARTTNWMQLRTSWIANASGDLLRVVSDQPLPEGSFTGMAAVELRIAPSPDLVSGTAVVIRRAALEPSLRLDLVRAYLHEALQGESRDGLERRTFDVRALGVRAPEDADVSEANGGLRIAPPPFLGDDALEEMVTSSVAPDSWKATGASAEVGDGTLVAWNKPEHLDAVDAFLLRLRERLAPQVEAHAKAFARNHRAFDVTDLLADGAPEGGRLAPEGLRAVVTSQVDPVSWLAEGRIEIRDGLLVVRASPENLEEIERLLARLRTSLPRTHPPQGD